MLGERGAGLSHGAPQPSHLLVPLPPRFLIKSYLNTQKSPGSASKGSLPQSVAYLTAPDLARCPAQTAADFLQPELYTTAWAHVAVRWAMRRNQLSHLEAGSFTLRAFGVGWGGQSWILFQKPAPFSNLLTPLGFCHEGQREGKFTPVTSPSCSR